MELKPPSNLLRLLDSADGARTTAYQIHSLESGGSVSTAYIKLVHCSFHFLFINFTFRSTETKVAPRDLPQHENRIGLGSHPMLTPRFAVPASLALSLLPLASLVRPILYGGSEPSSLQGVPLAGTSQSNGSSFNKDTWGTLAEDARQTASEGVARSLVSVHKESY